VVREFRPRECERDRKKLGGVAKDDVASMMKIEDESWLISFVFDLI
jgi:hypothetical protein